MSAYLEKPLREFAEYRRERLATTVTPLIAQVRFHLEQAETAAKRLSENVGGDAEDAASTLSDFIARDLIPDYLVPLETAVKEWLDSQDEPDAPVGKAR